MAVLPVITNGYRSRSLFSNVEGGRPFSIGHDHQSTAGTGSAADVAAEILEAWNNFFTTTITGGAMGVYFRDEVKLVSVTTYALDGTSAPVTVAPTAAVGGTSSQPALAPDLALVLSKRTAVRGARGRGRSYLGGFATTALSTVQPGLVVAALPAGIESTWASTFASMTSGTAVYEERVIGRIAVGSPIQAAFPITSYLCDQNWDVQRRRGLA